MASALATGHTSVPDPAPVVFRPVTVAAPSATPSRTATVVPLYEGDIGLMSRVRPTVPPITAEAGSTLKPQAKPKPKPKATVRVAPKAVVRTPRKAAPKPVARTTVPSVTTARSYARSRIGSTQFSCLDKLWTKESHWNPRAYNRSSGAYGIPQALPGSKMATVAGDWRYNPLTQVRWGLRYIAGRYGTACSAWHHSQATGWY
ncbi:MAG TPA: transglycosylase SLT domain-containing protein [Candidatus Limnocylindrales bacterium]|nr:transglycosylase SLT domain-containing protein [Candidatus Limnocylindrales bacterium]